MEDYEYINTLQQKGYTRSPDFSFTTFLWYRCSLFALYPLLSNVSSVVKRGITWFLLMSILQAYHIWMYHPTAGGTIYIDIDRIGNDTPGVVHYGGPEWGRVAYVIFGMTFPISWCVQTSDPVRAMSSLEHSVSFPLYKCSLKVYHFPRSSGKKQINK